MTTEIRRLLDDFIAYYSRGGGCSNCGGLPHSTTCFVGRFQSALLAPPAAPPPADPPLDTVRAALAEAVQTARSYFMLWHDETWRIRMEKWDAALWATPVGYPPPDVKAIADQIQARGRKHASGEPLFFDRYNLELAIRAGLLAGHPDQKDRP